MTTLRFGPADNLLHGVFHAAHAARDTGTAVLLCNPLGQEAVRIHRLYRVLADELAQAGIACLRFDYFGTGDSLGEDEEGHPERWVDDLVQAHAELGRRSRARRVVWVCARLAGVLAARASAKLQESPAKVVLWAPVTDGPAYLASLRAAHAAVMQPQAPAACPTQNELLGFGLHPDFEPQLRRMGTADYRHLRAAEVVVLLHAPDTLDAALAQALEESGAHTDHAGVPVRFDWTSEEALNTALVPKEALQTLSAWIQASPA